MSGLVGASRGDLQLFDARFHAKREFLAGSFGGLIHEPVRDGQQMGCGQEGLARSEATLCKVSVFVAVEVSSGHEVFAFVAPPCQHMFNQLKRLLHILQFRGSHCFDFWFSCERAVRQSTSLEEQFVFLPHSESADELKRKLNGAARWQICKLAAEVTTRLSGGAFVGQGLMRAP
jgi:hypothetical protein